MSFDYSRRELLKRSALGFGSLGLAGVLSGVELRVLPDGAERGAAGARGLAGTRIDAGAVGAAHDAELHSHPRAHQRHLEVVRAAQDADRRPVAPLP